MIFLSNPQVWTLSGTWSDRALSATGLTNMELLMKLIDGCHSLKLECALRELGFVDIGWKCVAHAGIFFVQPVGIPDDPEGDLLGFHITVPYAKDYKKIKMLQSARKALDFAQGID